MWGWVKRYRHRLPPKNDKILSATSEESSQLVRQNPLDIIGLFDFDADADRVDRRFNQHLFVFITGDVHWIQHDFRRCPEYQQKEGSGIGGADFASISGMLCRSTTWDEKFSRQRAAVRLARTQFR